MNRTENKKTSCLLVLALTIITFTIVQDVLCAFILNAGVPAKNIKLVFYGKEALIVLMGLWCICQYIYQNRLQFSTSDIFLCLFLVDFIIYFIIGALRIGFYYTALSSRVYIIPIMMYFVGQSIKLTRNNYQILRRWLGGFGFFLGITTLVERFCITVPQWQELDMPNFNYLVKSSALPSGDRLVLNFFTSGLRRAVGIGGDPLLMSYFMIPFFAYFFAKALYSKTYKKMLLNILGLGVVFYAQIMTLARAVILCEIFAVVALVVFLLVKEKRIYGLSFWNLLMAALLVVILVFFEQIWYMIYTTITFQDGGSAGTHYIHLLMTVENIKKYWYGLGIGLGSVQAGALGMGNLTTENAYNGLILDTGILGAIFFLAWVIAIIVNMYRKYRVDYQTEYKEDRYFYFMIIITMITFLATGMFSPQLWTMKTVLLLWLLMGVGRNNFIYKETGNGSKNK